MKATREEREKTLLAINKQILEMPPTDRIVVDSFARVLRIITHSDRRALRAMALVAAEYVLDE